MAVRDVFRAIRALPVQRLPDAKRGEALPLVGFTKWVVQAATSDGVVDAHEASALRHLLDTTTQCDSDRRDINAAIGVPSLLHSLPAQKFSRDKASALAAVCKDPHLYLSLAESMRADPEVALAAVERLPYLARHVPAALSGDTAIGLAALADPAIQLSSLPANMRANPVLRLDALARLFVGGIPPVLQPLQAQATALLAGDIDAQKLPNDLLRNPVFTAFRCVVDRSSLDTGDRAPVADVEMWLAWAQMDASVAALPIVNELRALSGPARASLSRQMLEARIVHLDRFASLASLRQVFADNTRADDRPLAVLAYPRADHNGAFRAWVDIAALQRHHRLIYREVESDREFEQAVATDYGKPANLLLIGGHGQKTMTQFGAGNGQHMSEALDYSDLPRLKKLDLASRVARGSKVVLFSCSTGEGGNLENNIANLVATLYPYSTTYAPTAPSGPRIQMSTDGLITDVTFPHANTYRVPAKSH